MKLTNLELLNKLSKKLTINKLNEIYDGYSFYCDFNDTYYEFETIANFNISPSLFTNSEYNNENTILKKFNDENKFLACYEFHIEIRFRECGVREGRNIYPTYLSSLHEPSRLTISNYYEAEFFYYVDSDKISIISIDAPSNNELKFDEYFL